VAGRNSDNTKIRQRLNWAPDTRLREGMEKTYNWILAEFKAKYSVRTAHQSSLSTFTKGSHPIPGDGFNPESKHMDTWAQGIPAGYGKAVRPAKSPARKAVVVKKASPKKAAPARRRSAAKR
jgi:hypothetical protein